jgi:hypothetical protein
LDLGRGLPRPQQFEHAIDLAERGHHAAGGARATTTRAGEPGRDSVAITPGRRAVDVLELVPESQHRGGQRGAKLIELTLAAAEELLEPADVGAEAGDAAPERLELLALGVPLGAGL